MNPTLLLITGPTGIGKTDFSIKVAKHFSTVILSADSRQIYREMKIGTAVPSSNQLQEVYHYFIGSHSVHDYYNASMYEEEVLALLKDLFLKHKVVVMTGGSMLYIDAVCKGIDDLPSVDPRIRQELISLYENEGIGSLRFELKRLDPGYYQIADLRNHKRLLHAIEICRMTGKPYSEFRTGRAKERFFSIIRIGLHADRPLLYERINQRVDKMIEEGMEEEARALYPLRELNALNTVGYREWFDYFDGITGREETISRIKSNTRRYARKQMTWFKKSDDIQWFDIKDQDQVIPWIENKLI